MTLTHAWPQPLLTFEKSLLRHAAFFENLYEIGIALVFMLLTIALVTGLWVNVFYDIPPVVYYGGMESVLYDSGMTMHF
jgi:hypothetical protein